MLIVQLMGGIGNQLFQYALYYKLKLLGRNVKIDDITWYRAHKEFYTIEELGLKYEVASEYEIHRLLDSSMSIPSRMRRKLFGRHVNIYGESKYRFDEAILHLREGYLSGYWQSEMYFKDISSILHKNIILDKSLDSANQQMADMIHQSESVSIHVRRGDYMNFENQRIYGNICTLEYYKSAMDTMREKKRDITFFVFSNDNAWAHSHFPQENVKIVEINHGKDDYLDMYLMSQCKHNIIANSSFSWWGAWLNQNEDKIVIAPYKWNNTREMADIYCERWIKI